MMALLICGVAANGLALLLLAWMVFRLTLFNEALRRDVNAARERIGKLIRLVKTLIPARPEEKPHGA